VICTPCANAADHQLNRDAHCHNAGCTCGHRTERYGTVTEQNTATTPPNGRRDG
jgi:hypothetical protein